MAIGALSQRLNLLMLWPYRLVILNNDLVYTLFLLAHEQAQPLTASVFTEPNSDDRRIIKNPCKGHLMPLITQPDHL